MGYRLGVDLGTTYTAAAVHVDGRTEMLGLGIRAMQVPSVVFVRDDGEIVVGEAAEQQGAADPSRVVREFKRRVGDSVPLVVGGSPFSAQALTARLLAWVVGVATERQGRAPDHVCVTYPANWGPFKRDLLDQAIEMAGLRGAGTSTCTEPEAAAIAYASRDRVAEGDRVAVYDLGGGTFDAAVLVREGAGFRLLGPPEGVEHLGGIDFDEAVFRHVLTTLGDDVAALDDTDPATATGAGAVAARLRRGQGGAVVQRRHGRPGRAARDHDLRAADARRVRRHAAAGDRRDRVGDAPGARLLPRHRRGRVGDGAGGRLVADPAGEPDALGGVRPAAGAGQPPEARRRAGRGDPRHAGGAAAQGQPQGQPNGQAAAGPPDARVPAAGAAAAAAMGAAAGAGAAAGWVPGAAAPATPPPAWASAPAAGPPAPATGRRTWGTAPHRRTRSVPPLPPPLRPPGLAPDPAAPARPRRPTGARPRPSAPPRPAPHLPAPGRPPPPVRPRPADRAGSAPWRSAAGSSSRLGVMAGVLLTRGGSEPTPAPAPAPTSAPSSPSPTPATAVLPRSAQPLANDVIVWPRRVGDNWDITTISTDGTVGPPLTDSPEEDNFPVVSPDRRTIAYLHRTSPTSREVRVMGADGSGDRALFATAPPGCTDVTRPAFNGPQLRLVLPCLDAATGATTLTLVELDGTVVSVVDRGAVGDPAMAPDGLSVVYWKAAEAGQDGGEIYWASLDGSSPAGPVTAGDDRDNDPAFSPTDNVAAFTRPGQGIWTVGLQVGNPVTQLTTRDGDMDPSFSPDGTQITFKRQDEVWVMDADGGNEKRVSEVGDVGTAAAWSPR